MTLLIAITVGVLFGSGTYLLLKPDLVRVAVGVLLISNAGILTLISSGRARGASPIAPFEGTPSDPLAQAMTVTAIVIGFAVVALMLSLVLRIHAGYGTLDLDEVADVEAQYAAELEREDVSV